MCWETFPFSVQLPGQPSVLCEFQNCVKRLPAGHPKEETRRPHFKDKSNKNLKGLVFLVTHTKNELGLVSPAGRGLQTVSSPWAI